MKELITAIIASVRGLLTSRSPLHLQIAAHGSACTYVVPGRQSADSPEAVTRRHTSRNATAH